MTFQPHPAADSSPPPARGLTGSATMITRHLAHIIAITLLSGCSCAITVISYSPVNRPPSPATIDSAAKEAGFQSTDIHSESKRRSYSKGVLGMHLIPATGQLEFVNSHCPIPPFWIYPGKSFEKRWDAMHTVLKALKDRGVPYRMTYQPSP